MARLGMQARSRQVRAGLWAAMASVVIAGCGSGGGPAPPDEAAEAVTDTSGVSEPGEDPTPGDSGGPPASSSIDMCDVVRPDDLATVVEAAAVPAPDPGELIVGAPTPLVAGECSFAVERPGTGSSHVQLQVGDDFTFGHYRDTEDVTDRPGLGDEAYWFWGVAGPEVHVRRGEMWLGVRFSSYDDRFGLTEDSHDEVATVVLDRLTGG